MVRVLSIAVLAAHPFSSSQPGLSRHQRKVRDSGRRRPLRPLRSPSATMRASHNTQSGEAQGQQKVSTVHAKDVLRPVTHHLEVGTPPSKGPSKSSNEEHINLQPRVARGPVWIGMDTTTARGPIFMTNRDQRNHLSHSPRHLHNNHLVGGFQNLPFALHRSTSQHSTL